MKLKQISSSMYFLIGVIIVYILLLVFKQDLFLASLSFFYNILIKIIPIFILVFVLMALTNYFVTPEVVVKHLGEKGIKKWFYVVAGGILSMGPIYMWYPLLADLKAKGLTEGLIACFLYNRAIKIPILPIAIFYFGWKYIIILCFVMIFMSVIQGMVMDKMFIRTSKHQQDLA